MGVLNVRLICVGKMRERFYIDAFSEYSKRLGAYCRFELTELAEDLQVRLAPVMSIDLVFC